MFDFCFESLLDSMKNSNNMQCTAFNITVFYNVGQMPETKT